MNTNDTTDYKKLLAFILHELRHINAMINESARILRYGTRGKLDVQGIRHHASVVFEQSAVLSSWLAIADMHIDPDRLVKEPKRRICLNDGFLKAIANFRRLAAREHISLVLKGGGKHYVNAHPILDILPYVLMDNAVKYSPSYSTVEISLDEIGAAIRIVTTSHGPCVEDYEMDSLCTVGFRGTNAQKKTKVGSGQGLALVREICSYHDALLKLSSDSNRVYEVNGIPHSEFKVEIEIPSLSQ